MHKFNMGSGNRRLDNYINVDSNHMCHPDVLWNLEETPWPFEDNCADEVQFLHSLEHMGKDVDTFNCIIKELYRICINGAGVRIVVPHHRSDDFWGDPTHVRPITAGTLALYSKENNEIWARDGFANTPLALTLGVDFKITNVKHVLHEPFSTYLTEGKLTNEKLTEMERFMSNVVQQVDYTLTVIKE